MTDQASHEKHLAMYYAYTALTRALIKSGVLTSDALFEQLAGATQQLARIGEQGAATHLGSIAQNMQGIDD